MNAMTTGSGWNQARTGDLPSTGCKVLLVDDHSLIIEVISAALRGKPGKDDMVVDTATTVKDALQKIARNGRYDVVLLDYQVPGMSDLAGLRSLIASNGGGVVLFSGTASSRIVERAIELGASGYVPKTSSLKTMRHAIQFVADGEIYLPADYLLKRSTGPAADFGLKPRERQVLELLCQGLQNKQIGNELGLEETIVKLDLRSICRKLGAANRTQAVIEARKLGLV